MTHELSLFYELSQKEIKPPELREIERKERWLKEVQKTVEADWKPKIIKVTYKIFDPEIERQRRFFEGAVVKYYCIQNEDMLTGEPSSELLKRYRLDILDQVLGYDVHLHNRIVRERKSTTDYKTVAAWNKFLNLLEETIFDAAGYEFPDSKEFWELVKAHGYTEAERISVENLQMKLSKKLPQ